jgi:hypothetical protein
MSKQLYALGEMPPLGEVPEQMHAWLIRPERFGKPTEAFQKEVVNTPPIADDEVLVLVMAAGINYNNVWAALGMPGERDRRPQQARASPSPFHIGGSDASGIVYARRQGRDQRQGRRRGGNALRPVEPQLPVGQGRRRPDVLAVFASGATRPTGAVLPSSPRCRATSACPSPST